MTVATGSEGGTWQRRLPDRLLYGRIICLHHAAARHCQVEAAAFIPLTRPRFGLAVNLVRFSPPSPTWIISHRLLAAALPDSNFGCRSNPALK